MKALIVSNYKYDNMKCSKWCLRFTEIQALEGKWVGI